MDERMIVHAVKGNFRTRGINLFVDEVRDGKCYTTRPIEMREVVKSWEEDTAVGPMVTLTPTMAQKLMDDLWDCGVRPSEGSGSAGQLASVKYHLEDLRCIVFKGYKK